MATIESSKTYELLFNCIIGGMLSAIFEEKKDYCLRDRQTPFILGENFEKYRKNAEVNMSNPRLDRHKLASCICGAIIETKPLSCLKGKKISARANEILALHVGLSVIKYYMIYDFLHNSNFSFSAEQEEQAKAYLMKNFDLSLPSLDDNICDTQEYEKNLLNALHWTIYDCKFKKDCYRYDIWAYAKIFYHLELYNMPKLKAYRTDSF